MKTLYGVIPPKNSIRQSDLPDRSIPLGYLKGIQLRV